MQRESHKAVDVIAILAALVLPALLVGFLSGWLARGAVVYDRETLQWHLKP
jgi:hypothetical protein